MTALDLAADSLLEATLRLFAGLRPAHSAETLDNMREILVEQFGCSEERSADAVRGALLRRASRSPNERVRQLARRVQKGD